MMMQHDGKAAVAVGGVINAQEINEEYVHRLWEYAALLRRRENCAEDREKVFFREKAAHVLNELEAMLGQSPTDKDNLCSLIDAFKDRNGNTCDGNKDDRI